MLSGGHACTGALAGALTSSAIGGLTGAELGAAGTAVGALLGAGAALLPDLDADGAAAYRSGGPLTAAIGEGLQWMSRTAYRRSRRPCDPNGEVEHRGLTHTLLFGVALGLVVGLLAQLSVYVTFAVMVLVLAPGIGALSRSGPKWVRRRLRTHRDVYAMLWAVAIAGALLVFGLLDLAGWFVGIGVGIGVMVHSAIGDGATHHGVPLLWPLKLRCDDCRENGRECRGSRWKRVHILPKPMRWRVGSASGKKIERVIEIVCLLAVAWLLLPDLAALMHAA